MTDGPDVIYLVRHGRTDLNAAGVLRGRLDPPLDDVGEAEAKALSDAFADVALGAVISSPLKRAVHTAAPIASATGVLLAVDEALLDRDYGSWAGTLEADVIARFGTVDAAPGVEPADEFAARVVEAIESIALHWVPRTVAVVAHDAVNRHALAGLVPSLGSADGIPQRTGCWNRLEHTNATWSAPIIDAHPNDGHRPR